MGSAVPRTMNAHPLHPMLTPLATGGLFPLECFGRAEPNEISAVLLELAAFLLRSGVAPSTRARAVSAAAELLDNVRDHAYDLEGGPFMLSARKCDHWVEIAIVDDGDGFEPNAYASSSARDPSQSGLARAAALVEDFNIYSAPGRGTRAMLRCDARNIAFDEEGRLDLTDVDFLAPAQMRRALGELCGGRDELELDVAPAIAVCIGRLLAARAQLHQRDARTEVSS
jgi:anti-sigma regulatory factor (Ser/Thr protein kinase)